MSDTTLNGLILFLAAGLIALWIIALATGVAASWFVWLVFAAGVLAVVIAVANSAARRRRQRPT